MRRLALWVLAVGAVVAGWLVLLPVFALVGLGVLRVADVSGVEHELAVAAALGVPVYLALRMVAHATRAAERRVVDALRRGEP